ncbi:MAG: DUF1707 and DUF2154 domain-containing protein [Deltaproteobacteria bacterium]|nr:DUF1707 and DUF2154 domain-containing protein [Deltaproteobacteria bacterium]
MDEPVDPSRIPTPAAGPLEPEREVTLARLHRALDGDEITLVQFDERVELTLSARTRAELTVLTRDLRPEGKAALPATRGRPMRVMAVLGGASRRGVWTAPPVVRATAVLGGVDLDFTRAELSSQVTEVRCVAVLGGIDIVVPPEVHVECHGTGIMGGFDSAPHESATGERPLLRVTGLSVLGGVNVRVRRRRR